MTWLLNLKKIQIIKHDVILVEVYLAEGITKQLKWNLLKGEEL